MRVVVKVSNSKVQSSEDTECPHAAGILIQHAGLRAHHL